MTPDDKATIPILFCSSSVNMRNTQSHEAYGYTHTHTLDPSFRCLQVVGVVVVVALAVVAVVAVAAVAAAVAVAVAFGSRQAVRQATKAVTVYNSPTHCYCWQRANHGCSLTP